MLSRANDAVSTLLTIAILAVGWGMARAMADATAQDVLPPVLRGMGAAVLYTCFDIAVGANAQFLGGIINGSDFNAFFTAALITVIVFGAAGLFLAARLISHDQREIIPAPGD